MSVSLEQFVQHLTQSGLMSAAEVTSFQNSLPADKRPKDAETLARDLVRTGRLTKYQAAAVYQGKGKGLVFGEYVVLDKLGQGGMGVVLKAQHRRMERTVAVKMIAGAALKSPDAVKRFYREVKAAARLNHSNIVTAYDASEHGGVHYLVMEYVEGKDLGAVVKEKGALSVAQAVDYTIQAARGLQYAHKQGIVHRDIKPANLLLDKDGTVKILDMGLARIAGMIDEDDKDRLTASGQVMGTCDYMAPEQAVDTHHADGRADIYSLGCALYRLLTGDSMYKGDTLAKILISHQMAPVPSLRAARGDISPQLDAVFQKMVAKKPEARQQTMAEVIADLEACLGKRAAAAAANAEASAADLSMDDNLSFLKTDAPRSAATAAKKKVETHVEALTVAHQAAADTSRQLGSGERLTGRPRKKKTLLVAIGAGMLGVMGVVGVSWYAITVRVRHPDGKETVVTVPDGSAVTVSKKGDVEVKVKADGKREFVAPAFKGGFDPHRAAQAESNSRESHAPSPSSERRSLFDGKTRNGWRLVDPSGPDCWTLENGQLICTPQPQSDAKNLVTEQTFRDFELQLEFLLEKNANSGVYLRGMYEIQVYDSDPQELRAGSCGAIYQAIAPSQPAYLGPDKWNSLAVKLIGQQVTVVMNEKCIIENAALDKPTDTKQTLHIPEGEPGPIMLQCMGSARTRFRNISIRAIGAPASADAAQPAAGNDWKDAVNLLPLIDPQRDAVAGEWSIDSAGLTGVKDGFARLEIPYQPPEEYDYRVEFTLRKKGLGGCQHLVKSGHAFTWNFFATARNLYGFEMVKGASINSNPTGVKAPPVEPNRRYVSLVEVRNDAVCGYLDGKLVVKWKTNYADLEAFQGWLLRDPSLLGVGCQSPAVFHRIEVREVTGKGKLTRAATKMGSVDDAFNKDVAALPAAEQVARVAAKLKELNPGFDGKVEHKIEDGVVVEFAFSPLNVTDLSPVRALPKLLRLFAVASTDGKRRSRLNDLTPLRGLALHELRVPSCDVSDLSPLRGMPLDHVGIKHTLVSDLSPLKGAPLGIALQCSGAPVSDLTPVAGAKVKLLTCDQTQVRDLTPLRNTSVEILQCDQAVAANPTNLEVLRSIKTLKTINFGPAARFFQEAEKNAVSPTSPSK